MNTSLAELLHDQLRDLYDAEQQYQQMLPRMSETVTNQSLAAFLTDTEEATRENIIDLRQACKLLGSTPEGVTCEAMQGLIRETHRTAEETADSATMDAALIANAQRIAHYEIAGFGTASAFARCLKSPDAAAILARMACNAGKRDQQLSKIATGGWFTPGINDEAAALSR